MKISKTEFGSIDGKTVYAHKIADGDLEVVALDFGATLQSIKFEGRDVLLGYDDLSSYVSEDGYLGAVVGRCGNRIAKGIFTLDGIEHRLFVNNGPNHLHGGKIGFSHRLWSAEELSDGIKFTLFSADGEEGYPGNLSVSVTYTVSDNGLNISYDAVCDQNTVCNLTNHAYFNLNGAGSGSALTNEVMLNADFITPVDDTLIPDGTLMAVENTPFDFRRKKPISKDISADDAQLQKGPGYDHNFVLKKPLFEYGLCAKAFSADGKVQMTVFTDRPGVQFYSGNFLTERSGKNGATYLPRDGFCMETQCYPDSVNHPNFPSVVLPKGECYSSKTRYEFVKQTD